MKYFVLILIFGNRLYQNYIFIMCCDCAFFLLGGGGGDTCSLPEQCLLNNLCSVNKLFYISTYVFVFAWVMQIKHYKLISRKEHIFCKKRFGQTFLVLMGGIFFSRWKFYRSNWGYLQIFKRKPIYLKKCILILLNKIQNFCGKHFKI